MENGSQSSFYTVTGVLALVVRLAAIGFQDSIRNAGIVLLSGAGITTLFVFMIATRRF
jgi:hypothetical protein